MRYVAVATAYIHQGDETLLLRRSAHNKHFCGAWQLPEGKLEKEESSVDALSRELEEELHCIPSSMRLLGRIKTSIVLEDEKVEVERAIFHVVLQDAAIRLSNEHDAIGWMDTSSLEGLTFYPGTLEALEMSTGRE